jgi:hypothetical protein
MEFASSYVFTPQRSTHAAADDDRAEAEAGVEIGEEDLEAGLESFSSPIAAPPQAQQPPPPLMGPSGGGGFLSGIKSAMMGFGAPAMAELPSPAPAPPATASASGNGSARSAGRRKQRKTYRREADTNIISIKLGSLGEDVAVATGDPCVCVGCGAMFSSLSKVMVAGGAAWTDVLHDDASSTSPPVMQPQPADDDGDSMHLDTIAESPRGSSMAAPAMGGGDDGILGACDDAASGTSKWVCEFCGHQNVLDLEPEELPTSATMDYLVQPAPARDMEHGSELIVFAIDISGSMCVTSEIEGLEVNLRGGGPDAREVLAVRKAPPAQLTTADCRLPTDIAVVTAGYRAAVRCRWSTALPLREGSAHHLHLAPAGSPGSRRDADRVAGQVCAKQARRNRGILLGLAAARRCLHRL